MWGTHSSGGSGTLMGPLCPPRGHLAPLGFSLGPEAGAAAHGSPAGTTFKLWPPSSDKAAGKRCGEVFGGT